MRITIKVKTNSFKDQITKDGEILTVSVKDAPIHGKANDKVIKLLARKLKIEQSEIKIVAGHNNRQKIIAINDVVVSNLVQYL